MLMVAFNNCGQPGDIRFDHLSNKSSEQDNTDAGIDNPESGAPVNPDPGVPPTIPGVPTEYRKIEKVITLSETQKADILFVVDNSISMFDEQASMSSKFPLFIQNLKEINWRVGIITTDVSDATLSYSDGQLQRFDNGELFIDTKIPTLEAENLFSKTIQRTESGSGYEQGIYATYRFLEREPSRPIPFLREDSSINVVFVSDADETPFENMGVPIVTKRNKPAELIQYLTTTWPKKKFQFHSIVVKKDDSLCLGVSDNESYGITYEMLSDLTMGIKGSVCAPDYGRQLTFLSESIKDLIKVIQLECEPVIDPQTGQSLFTIKLDGQNPIEIEKIVGKEVFLKGDLPLGYIKLEYYCRK